ncbi:MFS transporter [Glutamicibacter sp. BW80]|nr:MFS transporter [Glutamicibacter sp. BW80]PCC27390.1 MFS transporter [Glutamicibacter sp. BW80]
MSVAPTSIDSADRRARGAVSALFLTNGALFANMAPRLPELKDTFGLGEAAYGFLVIAWPVGAIIAGLASGWLIRRFGSALVAVAGTMLTGAALLGAGSAPSLALLATGFLFGGAMDAITDVAQNSHGLLVQRRYGRSILNSFHALWSVGAVLGGSMAAGAMALNLSLSVHLGISLLIFAVVALTALKFCLPMGKPQAGLEEVSEDRPADPSPGTARTARNHTLWIMVALVLISTAGVMTEDAGNSWAALYLADSLGTSASFAALGYISLVGAQFVGRILGDGMVDRFGQRLVAQMGAVCLILGMGLALAFPSVPGSVLGFAAAGFGVATLVPAAMEHADRLPGLAPGTGLSVVSWLMRLGFLISPPLVGFVAEGWGLRAGLLLVPLVGVIVLLCSPVLRAKAPRQQL